MRRRDVAREKREAEASREAWGEFLALMKDALGEAERARIIRWIQGKYGVEFCTDLPAETIRGLSARASSMGREERRESLLRGALIESHRVLCAACRERCIAAAGDHRIIFFDEAWNPEGASHRLEPSEGLLLARRIPEEDRVRPGRPYPLYREHRCYAEITRDEEVDIEF